MISLTIAVVLQQVTNICTTLNSSELTRVGAVSGHKPPDGI